MLIGTEIPNAQSTNQLMQPALVSNERGNFMNAAKESPISLLICMINFLSIWSIMGLSGYIP